MGSSTWEEARRLRRCARTPRIDGPVSCPPRISCAQGCAGCGGCPGCPAIAVRGAARRGAPARGNVQRQPSMSEELSSVGRSRLSGVTRERALLKLEQHLRHGESMARVSETVGQLLGCSASSVAQWWRMDVSACRNDAGARTQALHREVNELRPANQLRRAACESAWLQMAQAKEGR